MLFLSVHQVRLLFLYLSATALAFLVFGLFKPWVMVWWEDVQNRRKVIKLYGTIALISFALYLVLLLF